MKRFAYLDIEATHTNWHDADIIEIAFIIKNEKGEDLDFFHSLVRPQKSIEHQITELTGITDKMVEQAPEFHQIADKVFDKLKDSIIVAHKAEFDMSLLQKKFQELSIVLSNKTQCTLKLSQQLIPELHSYSLKNLCELLQIKLKSNHRALDDASALAGLHTYLRLIKGELTEVKKYLPQHKKLINRTPQRPGVIVFNLNGHKSVYKTENLHRRLEELLLISPQNKERINAFCKIKIIESASLVDAGLIETQIKRPHFPFCIYQVKNKQGKVILRVGKTDIRRKALYYTKTRRQAEQMIKNLISTSKRAKFAYQDTSNLKDEIAKENIELAKQIKKVIMLEKNYLIRSLNTKDGEFHYTLIKGNKSYATFRNQEILHSIKELKKSDLKLKPMGPREYMSLNHSMLWIKNQRQKTDQLIEVGKLN